MLNLPSALVSAPNFSLPPLLARRKETCARSTGMPLTALRTSPSREAGFSSARGGWVCASAPIANNHTRLLFGLRIGILHGQHFQVFGDAVAGLELHLFAALKHLLEH